MAIGIITGSGTYALPGFEGSGPRAASRRRGATRSVSRGAFAGVDVLHVSRHEAGPRAAVERGHPPREHRGARAAGRQGRHRRDGVRRGRPVGRARLARLLRRPALPRQPPRRRRAVHLLPRAGRPAPRPLDLRGPVLRPAARGAAQGRAGGRASRCATAAATATSTARASTPGPRSAASRRAASPPSRRPPGPETVLCGEAELPYALLGYATDYANGVQDEATPVQTLIDMMAASTETFARGAGRRDAAGRGRRPRARRHGLPLRRLALDDAHRRRRAAGDAQVAVAERVLPAEAAAHAHAVVAADRADARRERAQAVCGPSSPAPSSSSSLMMIAPSRPSSATSASAPEKRERALAAPQAARDPQRIACA